MSRVGGTPGARRPLRIRSRARARWVASPPGVKARTPPRSGVLPVGSASVRPPLVQFWGWWLVAGLLRLRMGCEPTRARATRAPPCPIFESAPPKRGPAKRGHTLAEYPPKTRPRRLRRAREEDSVSQSQGFGAGSADTAQCTGNASRERKRTDRCVPHAAGTGRRTSAARVTHACIKPMQAEGNAATDRDNLAPLFPPARAPSGAWRGGFC